MPDPTLLFDAKAIQEALARMAQSIRAHHSNLGELLLVGIQRGGVVLAKRLSRILSTPEGTIPVGSLDINMHRDDLNHRATPTVHPTEIPFDINDKAVVLVDDVLFSGRTTRAALDALTDLGRPKRIELAVLIDRGHRELPIQADYIGHRISTELADRVSVELDETGDQSVVLLERA